MPRPRDPFQGATTASESRGGSEGGLATVFGEMIDDFSLMWLIYKEMDAKFEICEQKYPIDNANIICKHA